MPTFVWGHLDSIQGRDYEQSPPFVQESTSVQAVVKLPTVIVENASPWACACSPRGDCSIPTLASSWSAPRLGGRSPQIRHTLTKRYKRTNCFDEPLPTPPPSAGTVSFFDLDTKMTTIVLLLPLWWQRSGKRCGGDSPRHVGSLCYPATSFPPFDFQRVKYTRERLSSTLFRMQGVPVWFENCTELTGSTSKPSSCRGKTEHLFPTYPRTTWLWMLQHEQRVESVTFNAIWETGEDIVCNFPAHFERMRCSFAMALATSKQACSRCRLLVYTAMRHVFIKASQIHRMTTSTRHLHPLLQYREHQRNFSTFSPQNSPSRGHPPCCPKQSDNCGTAAGSVHM